MESHEKPVKGEAVQLAPIRSRWSWKKLVGVTVVVLLFLLLVVMGTFPIAKIGVTIESTIDDNAFVCVFIDHHNVTGVNVGPGEEVECGLHVTAGTHRVQVYQYLENWSEYNGIVHTAPYKVEAFSTVHIHVAVGL